MPLGRNISVSSLGDTCCGVGRGVFLACFQSLEELERPVQTHLGFKADMPLKSLCSHPCCLFRQPEDVLTVRFRSRPGPRSPRRPRGPRAPAGSGEAAEPAYEVGAVIRSARDSLTP